MNTVLVSVVWAVVLCASAYVQLRRLDRALEQIDRLCQRIQAPEVAVAQYVADHVPVTEDDDIEDPAWVNIP